METFYLYLREETECNTTVGGDQTTTCRALDLVFRALELSRKICREKKERPVKPRRKRQFGEYDLLHSIKYATCKTSDVEFVNIINAYTIVSGEVKNFNKSETNLAIRHVMCCNLEAGLAFGNYEQ